MPRVPVKRHLVLLSTALLAGAMGALAAASSPQTAKDRKSYYVRSITRGGGLMPWQEPGITTEEREFRRQIERRKDELLASRTAVQHPVMLRPDEITRARRNIERSKWAPHWAEQNQALADYLVGQPTDYVERMIPELTPTNTYGFTCPRCVGVKSQEGMGTSLMRWDYRNPDVCSCRRCGQVYPSPEYPETARLLCPRSGQAFTYYLNDRERADPEDRSGKLAWHWVGRPIHMSFTGRIRAAKVGFMVEAPRALALQYALSGDSRYAARAIEILVRLARCYRHWLYHDYWDTIADCDPMYAAWHDRRLPLEFKKHLCEEAFARDKDFSAAMLQSFWGAGRIHPSTDGIGHLVSLALAYDLVHDAMDNDGRPLWSEQDRRRVERDLLLEYLMGAEPFLGGAGKADCVNNKAPASYHAMAAVGQCLGLAGYADTALRGYENIRDQSFLYDGFSRESPAYTNMYLSPLVQIPEQLHGFRWRDGYTGRQGSVDVFANDARLQLMFRAMIDQLRPDGRYPPLSDTNQDAHPARHLVEMGLKHYPEYYRGKLPTLRGSPSPYALFALDAGRIAGAGPGGDPGLQRPEVFFPAWMTAFLRHGRGADAAMLTLAFNPDGGHRHADNLALFYSDGGHTILGDQGYLGDMPQNKWIKSTASHNLVIVDGAEQRRKDRQPRFLRMFTSPRVSVVEASSNAYPQCSEYSRLVVLIKAPAGSKALPGRTFLVDIFRATGGRKHDYRLFSEIAASDEENGSLGFVGLNMPAESPLPQVGASLDEQDIFGLRDVRLAPSPPGTWQAIWKQEDRQYRLWMLTPAARVEASNGPGQETLNEPGRRVRYLDVVREGEKVSSTFVAVHEPSELDGSFSIRGVQRLAVPASAGPDAVALRIESDWGSYTILNRFAAPAEVQGIQFQGQLAVVHKQGGKAYLIAQEVVTLGKEGLGFAKATPVWSGNIAGHTDSSITADTARPSEFAACREGVQNYVMIRTADQQTGLPVSAISADGIVVDRFPVPDAIEFRLPNLRIVEK